MEVTKQEDELKKLLAKVKTFFLLKKVSRALKASYALGREGSVLVIPDES